jgi:transposase
VARWTKMFESGGDDALTPIPNAGGTSRMTARQRVKLGALLLLGARMNGFPTEMWTLRRVRELVEREFGIKYSISNVHLLMHGIGFSSQKAVRRAREQNADAVAEFRAKEWPRIKKSPCRRPLDRAERRERFHVAAARDANLGASGEDAGAGLRRAS